MKPIFDPGTSWSELGPRTHHAILRMPRDFSSNSLIAFTARQMADQDCNLFGEAVPNGQRWQVNALSFVPNSPMDFDAFRKLCVTYPMGYLALVVPNMESLAQIPLSWFWQDGEYILHPTFPLQTPAALVEMTVFRVKVILPESKAPSIPPPEVFLKQTMERSAFRVSLHTKVWGQH